MATSTARSTLWNAAGIALPLVVGFATISVMVRNIGADRFGFVVLSWSVAGYFSIFDFGMGRALTIAVSRRLGANAENCEVVSVCRVAYCALIALGTLSAILLASFSETLCTNVLKLPIVLRDEAVSALLVLAITVPITILNSAAHGILAGYSKFAILNKIRIAIGTATSLLPAFASFYSNSLVILTLSLLGARVIGLAISQIAVSNVVGSNIIGLPRSSAKRQLRELLAFGGWMSTSNIVSPIMVYFDRFFIAALDSLKAVAYYSAPFTLASRLGIFGEAHAATLLPKFARDNAMGRSSFSDVVKSTLWILHLTMPFCIVAIVFGDAILKAWLGPDFAENGRIVLKWVCVGVVANSLAQLPFAYIQAKGRPDITAKLHLFELPLYALGLWWLVPRFGISAAAAVWALRAIIDALLLFWLARMIDECQESIETVSWHYLVALVASLTFLCVAFLPPLKLVAGLQISISTMLAYCLTAWVLLPKDERKFAWDAYNSVKHILLRSKL